MAMTFTAKFDLRRVFLFAVVFCSIISSAQTYKIYNTQNYHNQLRLNTATGEVKQIQDDGQSWVICPGIDKSQTQVGRYNLNETQNMWTFILLDSFTGKTWQVQFSTKGTDYMFYTPINRYSLSYPSSNDNWKNRFQLFPTQNIWNFILLDSYTGRLWQVQFSSQDLDALMCIPINETELASASRPIFTISPLTSMYQYYLINESNGSMWKFQWSTKDNDYRWIEKCQ